MAALDVERRSFFAHAFTGLLEHKLYGDGSTNRRLAYVVVRLPAELDAKLPPGRLRMRGEIEGHPVALAWQTEPGARRYVMLSRALLRDAGLRPGAEVPVCFDLAPDDDHEVPEALQSALAKDRRAGAAWKKATAGARRGMIHRVASARRKETVQRRVSDVIAELRGEKLPPPRNERERAARAPRRQDGGRKE